MYEFEKLDEAKHFLARRTVSVKRPQNFPLRAERLRPLLRVSRSFNNISLTMRLATLGFLQTLDLEA
jgi:hypothetical protein